MYSTNDCNVLYCFILLNLIVSVYVDLGIKHSCYLCLVVLLSLYIVMHCNEMSREQIKLDR